jgi:hypothetical protein
LFFILDKFIEKNRIDDSQNQSVFSHGLKTAISELFLHDKLDKKPEYSRKFLFKTSQQLQNASFQEEESKFSTSSKVLRN